MKNNVINKVISAMLVVVMTASLLELKKELQMLIEKKGLLHLTH